jgi:predicted MFS family arabinose efflux permease
VLVSLSAVVVVMDVFATSMLTPVVGMLCLGVTHSTAAAVLWPSVALLVPLRLVGSAVAIMSSVQMFGVALWNAFAGAVLDHSSYTALVWARQRQCVDRALSCAS